LVCSFSCGGVAEVGCIFWFQRASAAADLELGAFFAFFFDVCAASDFLCCWVVPDAVPVRGEDVAEGFEVALAGVDVAVGSDAHVDEAGCAGFYA
jgi:hypothetical protein